MKKKDLTVDDLKYHTNDLIKSYNLRYPNRRENLLDPASQVGMYEIGAIVGRIAGRLNMSMGQTYSVDDLASKIGEIKRELEKDSW